MERLDAGLLFIFGLGLFGGMIGAWLFQRMRIPQVIGYIAIGLIIGQSGLGIIGASHVERLQPFNLFALGIIGFLVGGELQLSTFQKYAKQFTAILLGEGLGAFLLVGVPSVFIVYGVTQSWSTAFAVGIVFGAIASATDPASTIDVLWEYRSQGILTTSVIAIVALDDALAMTLYGLGTGVAQMLTSGSTDLSEQVLHVSVALVGAVALGLAFAYLFRVMLTVIHQPDRSVALAVGLILLAISISVTYGMDVILATMALGFGLVNLEPRRSKVIFELMRSFSIPIYVLFFVLVGARLVITQMPPWLWALVAVYIIGRSVGKIVGAYVGGAASNSSITVRKYIGLGLFAQGGVAVGLSIMASAHLGNIQVSTELSLGDAVIFGITTTTLILQFLGPPLIKLAAKLADEIGRDVTEEDVIKTLAVRDVMDTRVTPVYDYESLEQVIERATRDDYLVYPVMDRHGRVAGVLSMDSLKQVLADREVWAWLVVADVMELIEDKAGPDEPLGAVLDRMRELRIDEMVVVTEANEPRGLLDIRFIRKRLDEELLRRRNLPVPGAAVLQNP